MSVISVGTGSSLVSLGIIVKPPKAYRKPPMEMRLRELRSCGNSVNSDHLTTQRSSGTTALNLMLHDCMTPKAEQRALFYDLRIYCSQWVIALLQVKWVMFKHTVISLFGCDVVDLHRAGEAWVRDARHHIDLVVVDSDAKQGTCCLQRSQVFPFKLGGVVDTNSPRAFSAQKNMLNLVVARTHPVDRFDLKCRVL